MTERFTELEETVRERLARDSADVPDIDAMRERVLAALENDGAAVPTRATSAWSRHKNTARLLAVAAAIAAVVVFLPEQSDQTVVGPSDARSDGEAATAPVESSVPVIGFPDSRDALAPGAPRDELGNWIVLTEDPSLLTLEFVPDAAEPGDPRQYLRIVATPAATTAAEVIDSLTSSLFDTTVVGIEDSRIGGLESRAIRLETDGGTTRLGFKLAPDTYLETEGLERVFVVHVTVALPETLVLWIDAGPEQIEGFEEIASRLVADLGGG